MKNDYTHITVILDRTGSMESIRDDTIGGFNTFLNQQKEAPGAATMTLVQFDSQDPYEIIHRFKPVAEVPELDRATFVPRASTPLLDALGRGINDLEMSLAKRKGDALPSKILFALVTDGRENASREFNKRQIEAMIKDRTEQNQWQFVFLSADLGAIREAMALGVRPDAALCFDKSAQGTADAWAQFSLRACEYRSAAETDFRFDKKGGSNPEGS